MQDERGSSQMHSTSGVHDSKKSREVDAWPSTGIQLLKVTQREEGDEDPVAA